MKFHKLIWFTLFLCFIFPSTSIGKEKFRSINFPASAICLARNMYFEARNQGTAGIIAVTAVVLNRVKDKNFPNTVCEVVKEGPIRESWKTRNKHVWLSTFRKYYPIKHRCQFSWYCDGKTDNPKDKKLFEKFLKLAKIILTNQISLIDITDGALYYHADTINPRWSKTKKRTAKINNHIFYR